MNKTAGVTVETAALIFLATLLIGGFLCGLVIKSQMSVRSCAQCVISDK